MTFNELLEKIAEKSATTPISRELLKNAVKIMEGIK